MKSLMFVVAFLSAVLASEFLHPLSDEFIEQINAQQSTWKAGRNFEIEDYELVKILASGSKGIRNREVLAFNVDAVSDDIPESFDAREAWPNCADVIGLIRDQSQCSASWAFAAAETMSDRICIHSNATKKILVSSQDVLTCSFIFGCEGGNIDYPWSQWNQFGYVSGGLYNNTSQGCKSYFLPSCDGQPSNCSGSVRTPSCVQQCDDNSLNYNSQYTYGQRIQGFSSESRIQQEILTNGPVEGSFNVFQDFVSYQSGIYQYVNGSHVGEHAVKILGWGVENSVKYWLVANSWNEKWGENGYFRILRGTNECNIESDAVVALPDFNRFFKLHIFSTIFFVKMKSLAVACLFVTVSAVFAGKLLHPLSDEFIDQINAKQSTWTAGKNFEIEDYELVKVLASGSKGIRNREALKFNVHDDSDDVPESFDSREAWPECADVIGLIRDQSRCGACWAFAAAEAMSDRICIHSNATRKTLVSSQDILTCTLSYGCDGGSIDAPWSLWYEKGYVTGGLYNNTSQGCQSYFLPNCEDHPNKCTNYVNTPSCVEQCDDTSVVYSAQKTYGLEAYSVSRAKQIQLEILKNGPVETAFDVYQDFVSYKSGIYQYTAGDLEGGHAVKIIGWGVENGVKYWLIANSWNERWGENGYFRMLRGTDECGIESFVAAGLPDFTKF
ncbi:uncharacterized protein LOC115886666 [Sitophilus oryzae]|uniref:Uncharacterized protein LOC115886666 n=1 Tax=Sitophilus oryzae TaxID=7048 RepID=A0A6J2YD20_SITOR|nr:uncharacterized protein LOC115886666 [Sitophilus oryzae]